jgi:hypothetical protein
MTGRNPWVVLCVAEDAPYHEVQRAFRLRAKQTHPDGGGDAGEFTAVVQAFEAVRQTCPPRPRRCPARPTPYDSWLGPVVSTASGTDEGRAHSLTSDVSAATWMMPPVPSAECDFTTVLDNEIVKARAMAACASGK